MFRLDQDVGNDVRSGSIHMVSEGQSQGPPQVHPNGLRSLRNVVHVETCLKAAEPEGRRKQLERAEDVPQQRLTKTVILYCAQTRRWTAKAVWVMRRDDDLLSNGLGWSGQNGS